MVILKELMSVSGECGRRTRVVPLYTTTHRFRGTLQTGTNFVWINVEKPVERSTETISAINETSMNPWTTYHWYVYWARWRLLADQLPKSNFAVPCFRTLHLLLPSKLCIVHNGGRWFLKVIIDSVITSQTTYSIPKLQSLLNKGWLIEASRSYSPGERRRQLSPDATLSMFLPLAITNRTTPPSFQVRCHYSS